LLAAIDGALLADPLVEARFRVPQSEGAALAALEAGAVVSREELCREPGVSQRARTGVAAGSLSAGFASGNS
jgi:hypothetical protein